MPIPRRFERRYIPYTPGPRWGRYLLIAALVLTGLALVGTAGAIWYVSQDLPSLDSLHEYQPSLVTRVYADDQQIVGQFYVERRILTPLTETPENLKRAVIAVEDARFFEHPGLDVIGILRAVWTNLRRGGRVEGASTITQQLARSLFLSSERTYGRKLRELVLAYKIELVLSKEQILEMYLNQIYFGQGAYGVAAAAQTYFGKDLGKLALAESALLAGLPKSPNNYSPFKHYDRAKKRQEHVLSRMEEAGFITEAERLDAAAMQLAFRHPGAEQIAPHFMEYVRQHLMTRYGETMVYKGGLEISTSLNIALQKTAEAALRRGLRRELRKGTGLEEQKRILNEYKDRELFRIDIKHLLEHSLTLTDFSQALTDLAEVVIEETDLLCRADLVKRYGAPRIENRRPSSFAICGLGKLGGAELGYASDIELLFVYEGAGRTDGRAPIDNRFIFEKLAQQMTHFITAKQEGIFHIDTRLRPHGNAGVLANPLAQLTAYYSPAGEAAPFERQALIKLRWIAGDEALGRKVEAHRDRFVYGETPWDLKTALALRERQRTELVPKGKINVKYSAGGLLDIEYAVQYLQIVHGHRHPALRTPHTLAALEQLRRLKILPKEIWIDFQAGYLFLRSLIDALRIVRGHAKDLILPDVRTEEFTFLARRMGYGQRDWERGRKEFEEEIQHHIGRVRADFARLFEFN